MVSLKIISDRYHDAAIDVPDIHDLRELTYWLIGYKAALDRFDEIVEEMEKEAAECAQR